MLKCSTCKQKPTTQCNTCNKELFCDDCSSKHSIEKMKENIFCSFGIIRIQFSNAKTLWLRQSIKENIKAVKAQKVSILNEASKVITKVEIEIKQAFEKLDQMIEKYMKCYHMNWFEGNDLFKAQEMLYEKINFESPHFNVVEGSLTKNTISRRPFQKNISYKEIEANHDLCFYDSNLTYADNFVMSLDRKILITASYNIEKVISVWNLAKNKMEAKLIGHETNINCMTISKDNKLIISGSGRYYLKTDNTVRVWNLAKKCQEAVFNEHSNMIISVSITDNSKFVVSGSYDKTIRLWNLITKLQEHIILCHDRAWPLTITKNNKFILSGTTNGQLVLFNPINKQERTLLKDHKIPIKNTAVTKSGRFLVTVTEYQILVLTLPKNHQEASKNHNILPTCDNLLESKQSGYKRVLWKLLKKKYNFEARHHFSEINSIALTGDGKFAVTGSNDKTVRVWDLAEKSQVCYFNGHTGCVKSVAITSDDKYAISGSTDKTVRIWDLTEKKQMDVLDSHKSCVNFVSITIDNQCFSLSATELILWDLKQKNILKQIPLQKIHTVSKDNTYCITSYNKYLQVWNLLTKQKTAIFEGHTDTINCAAISNDNSFIASGSADITIRVWDLHEKHQKLVINRHKRSIESIYISSDNHSILSRAEDKTLRIWDLNRTKKEKLQKAIFEGKFYYNNELIVLENNMFIASISHNGFNLEVYNIIEKKQEIVFKNDYKILRIKKTNDKSFVILMSDKDMKVWNFADMRVEAAIEGKFYRIKSAIVTWLKQYLVLEFYDDNNVQVWNLESKKVVAEIEISDNIILMGFEVCHLENKIYLTTGLGISVYNIDENILEHEILFDKDYEDLYNDDPIYEEGLMPKLKK